MKIVVLDGYTLNPGDLSWDPLREFGELTIYDRTPNELILERAENAEIIFTNKTPLTTETLEKLGSLHYVGLFSTGYDIVDLTTTKKLGITVTNIPAYSTSAVAQMTFALLLECINKVGIHNSLVKQGKWASSLDFCFLSEPLSLLENKTFGILGFGNIGKAVARIALAFDMKVIVHTNHPSNFEGVTFVSFEELFKNSDILSLHAPINAQTLEIINKQTLSQMKNTAILINTARGKLINEPDLAEALKNNHLAAAAVDVLSTEPPHPKNPLLTAPNCIITPHIAWAALQSRQKLMNIAVGNLKAFLDGSPVNMV